MPETSPHKPSADTVLAKWTGLSHGEAGSPSPEVMSEGL